jgi:hypothetical protein
MNIAPKLKLLSMSHTCCITVRKIDVEDTAPVAADAADSQLKHFLPVLKFD